MTKQPSSIPASHTDPFGRKYKIIAKIGEGSYSEVLKCKNRESGSIYACKRLKHCYRSWNQVNDIPEIVTLRKLARHPNILQMVEIHFDPTAGRVSLVFELMDMNLYELIKDRKRLLPESRVRVMMFQLMRALRHLHKHGIFHRDVKPENILLRNDLLKLGDLGSVRGLYSRPPYTEYISTRWYRSPECLLTCGYYSFKMDVWAAGCVFYEILTLRPLFPGSSELDQINRIHNVLGPPPSKILQKFVKHAEIERDYSRHSSKQARMDTIKRVLSDMKNSNFDWYFTGKEPKGVNTLLPTHVTAEAKELLILLLQYDPDARPSSHRALQHAYFKDLREQAQRAAREKIPMPAGPIVTIVGDDGGLEVATDDNNNPIDLATLGDAKLKLKAPQQRHSQGSKGLDATTSRKTIHQDSAANITPNLPSNYLKEAGETFSREPRHPDMKSLGLKSSFDSTFSDDKSKLATPGLSSFRFGGDAASSLPYQKIFLRDEDDGDGPGNKSTCSAALLDDNKRKHSSLIRRRMSSKIEIERKKSVTSLSQDMASGRNFPLELIDKAALTPDAIARMNENRRIAQMQPLPRPDINKNILPTDSAKLDIKRLSPPKSPTTFTPRNFQSHRNPQKPLKAEHSRILATNKDDQDSMLDPITPRYSHSLTNKQVKEVLATLPSKKKLQPPKPPERTKDTTADRYKTNHPAKSSHSRNQLVKNLSALRTKYEAESKTHFPGNVDRSISTDVHAKNGTTRKTDVASNKPSYSSLQTSQRSKKDHERRDHNERGRHSRDPSVENDSFGKHKYTDKEVAYARAVLEHQDASEKQREPHTERFEKGVVHRYELNRVPDRQNRNERQSPPERRDGEYVQERPKDSLERHVYEYQYTMASRKNSLLNRSDLTNGNSKSDGHRSESNYDSAVSLSPSKFRRVIENRRNVELVTTDTDGEHESYLQQHRKLEGSRRKKRTRHRPDASMSDRRDEVRGKSNYSPRTLLQPQLSKTRTRDTQQPHSDRVSAAIAAAAKYSNSSSLANKQVREILAEMRKRRDQLEEKVTKDANLMTWVKKVDSSKVASKASDTTAVNRVRETNGKDDFREPYSVYRATHNRVIYPVKKPNAGPVSSPPEKLMNRRRPDDYDYSRIKLPRQDSNSKYPREASDAKLGIKTSSDRSKNTQHQSSTGAGSKAFPRNRYGSSVHK